MNGYGTRVIYTIENGSKKKEHKRSEKGREEGKEKKRRSRDQQGKQH